MARVEDPSLVTGLIEGLDGDYDDARDVFVSVQQGGQGSTSASCWVELTDADTSDRVRFLVEVHLPEPEED